MSLTPEEDQRILRLEHTVQRQASDFEALRLLMEKNNTNLEEFIDLAKALKIGLKLLGWIEKTAVFITKVALACGTCWGAWKFLVKEAIAQVARHIK